MFDNIKIHKSGRELKNAIQARLELSKVSEDHRIDPQMIAILQLMSRNLVDNYRYQISLQEAILLNM